MDLVVTFGDIHIHLAPDHDPTQQIEAGFSKLHITLERLTMLGEETKKLVEQIDTETTAAATRVEAQMQALRDQIAAGNGDTAALQAVHDGLAPIAARLRLLGADTSNPIPVDPNPPVPTV